MQFELFIQLIAQDAQSSLTLETFRFSDEYDYEYEIFSVLSSARSWTSVILAGKCGSPGHSTTSYRAGENKITNVRSFIIFRSGKRVTSFTLDNSANFSSEKW